MKCSKVSSVLNKCIQILDLFEDIPLEDALDELYIIAEQKMGKSDKVEQKKNMIDINDYSFYINESLIEKMKNMNGEELTVFLQEANFLKTKDALLFLTQKLDITNSKRHSMDTLRHFIISYFERERMNEIIQKERK